MILPKVSLHRASLIFLGLTLFSFLVITFTSPGLYIQVGQRKAQHASLTRPKTVKAPSTDIPPTDPRLAGELKILFVGDSITHGNEGDFTWRFRLWQWLQSQHVKVDFVGPFVGTVRPPDAEKPAPPALYSEPKKRVEEANTNGTYATGAKFPNRHFSIAGRAAALVKGLVEDVAAEYEPDVVLVLLGFNDLRVFGSKPYTLNRDMLVLIRNVRMSVPRAKIVIGTVPQVSSAWTPTTNDLVERTDEYNEQLKKNVPDWSSEESPIFVADVAELYNCSAEYETDCPAGFDGLHPNELGEYQIAQAFSRTLVKDLKIGETPIVSYEAPQRVLGVPSNFTLVSSPHGVTATWNRVFGAYNYDVNVNKSTDPGKSPWGATKANRWDSDSRLVNDNTTFHVRVRARAGVSRIGEWSEWLEAVAHPRPPPPPVNITSYAVANRTAIEISWIAPETEESEISTYNVKVEGCGHTETGAFNGTTARLENLRNGARYAVAVESWSVDGVGGRLGPGQAVLVGGLRTPDQVANLKAVQKSATVAQLRWDVTDSASGYMVWRTDTRTNEKLGVDANPVGVNCFTSGALLAGISNYEWSVTAVNGDAEGVESTPVVAVKGDGTELEECPKPTSICPPPRGMPSPP